MSRVSSKSTERRKKVKLIMNDVFVVLHQLFRFLQLKNKEKKLDQRLSFDWSISVFSPFIVKRCTFRWMRWKRYWTLFTLVLGKVQQWLLRDIVKMYKWKDQQNIYFKNVVPSVRATTNYRIVSIAFFKKTKFVWQTECFFKPTYFLK